MLTNFHSIGCVEVGGKKTFVEGIMLEWTYKACFSNIFLKIKIIPDEKFEW